MNRQQRRRSAARKATIEKALGDREICPDCHATLKTYAAACTAGLGGQCPGFQAIEAVDPAVRK